MNVIRALLCLIGLHNWWHAGGAEFVCLDCGYASKTVRRRLLRALAEGRIPPPPAPDEIDELAALLAATRPERAARTILQAAETMAAIALLTAVTIVLAIVFLAA